MEESSTNNLDLVLLQQAHIPEQLGRRSWKKVRLRLLVAYMSKVKGETLWDISIG
jgi:hypothetical protein